MRAIFREAADPEAVTIRTGITTYKGAAHFEATHGETGDRNIGSEFEPLAHADACDCEDGGGGDYAERHMWNVTDGCHEYTTTRDAYGQDEANGAACRAMATALAAIQKERKCS